MKISLVLLALAPSAFAQNAIWMSRAEALQCPKSGAPWEAMLLDANGTIVPNVNNMNDNSDAHTLAVALVWLRLQNTTPWPPPPPTDPPEHPRLYYRDKIVSICDTVADTIPTDPDAVGRNTLGYILAADIINLAQVNPTVHEKFRDWILDDQTGTGWLPQASRPLKKSRREAKRAATRLGTRRRDGASGLPGR